MVREERINSDDHIVTFRGVEAEAAASSGVVEKWLQSIRARIPAGAVLSATVRSKPRSGFFASFRLTNEGEVISSEARAESVEEAVEKAGLGLCQHLPFENPEEEDLYLAG
jgi:hypothetical protein